MKTERELKAMAFRVVDDVITLAAKLRGRFPDISRDYSIRMAIRELSEKD